MNNTTKTAVFEYSLRINGLFGRNRKAQGKSIPLFDSAEKAAPERVSEAVQAALVEAKCKPGCQYRVTETPVTIESTKYPDGVVMTSRCFMVFSGVKVAEGVVA
jgi:hypothetical protein